MRILIISILIVTFSIHHGFAEITDTIRISFSKTVVLVFDKPIIFDNVGSEDVIAQKMGNRYLLTAAVAKKKFETNLVIETESGYYQYILVYNEYPKKTFFAYTASQSIHKTQTEEVEIEEQKSVIKKEQKTVTSDKKVETKKKKETVNDFNEICKTIDSKDNSLKSIGVVGNKMFWSLGDIYVNNDHLYFKVSAKNLSNIKYDIDFVKFVVRSTKGNLKQRSVQEEELSPIFVYNGDKNVIEGKTTLTKVLVFKKFTIDDEKKLFVELWEVGGDRKLEFSITNKDILKVKTID